MIFVTVGAQMPFDRLVSAVDRWAGDRARQDICAQIGPTSLKPGHMEWHRFLEPPQFADRVASADAIVAHAGMGSILTALAAGKPILVMPRRGDLRETRNDHQIATARRFGPDQGVFVAMDEHELNEQLDRIDSFSVGAQISSEAPEPIISAIRSFIGSGVER